MGKRNEKREYLEGYYNLNKSQYKMEPCYGDRKAGKKITGHGCSVY